MSYQFTDEDHKEVNTDYFEEGVFKVKIEGAVFNETSDKKTFLEVSILGEQGQKADVRLYFTEKAARYSLNTVRTIFVHNAPEAKKDATRKAFDALKGTDDLDKLLEKMQGMEAWYSNYKSGTTYKGTDGKDKNSYDKNLYGYEPKPRTVAPAQNNTAKAAMGGGEDQQLDASEFPF